MCGVIRNVLCVGEVLNLTSQAAKTIEHIGKNIEKHILNKIGITNKLNHYVNSETDFIHSHLPTPQYYEKFVNSNNIDKGHFVHLLLEAHYAMNFYYNSIQDILHMNDPFASDIIDGFFKEIKDTLRNEIICPYRSMLYVYLSEWPPINHINRIQFSRYKYQASPSTIHDIHSIVITRLLSEWMERLNSVVINLRGKLY
jgi:hypothetical protein